MRPLSARLSVGKWREHAEAAAIIDDKVRVHGEGVDTIVRALLLYANFQEIVARAEAGEEIAPEEQLILDAGMAGESAAPASRAPAARRSSR